MRAVDQNPMLDPGIRALQQQQQDHPSLGEELSLNADMASQRPDSLQVEGKSSYSPLSPQVCFRTVFHSSLGAALMSKR